MRDYNGYTKMTSLFYFFFQEKEWLSLYIKELTKILSDPYQIYRHLRLEGHMKVN